MQKRLVLTLTYCLALLTAAAQHYEVIHLGGGVNTAGSETGAVVLDDTLLLFSSHGTGARDMMQLRLSSVDAEGRVGRSRPSAWGLNSRRAHTGNVAYDARHDRLFFTRCESDDTGAIQCAIWVSRRLQGRWQRPRRLGGDVNRGGTTNTQPSVAYQPDGSTLLYFVSDRAGGLGGLDIWYSVVRDDAVGRCVNLGTPVNSASDELTPFYDTLQGVLYFSSDRAGGLGGYDIYRAAGARDGWRLPQLLPAPLNSTYNDLYFTVGANCGCWGFLASNREDSFFEHDSSCCNDLYRWVVVADPDTAGAAAVPVAAVTAATAAPDAAGVPPAADLHLHAHPVTLYFHNDEPGPGGRSDTTEETYFQTYNRYMFMRGTYLAASRHSGADSAAVHRVELFFDEVRRNCDRFEQLMELMRDDLEAGRRVAVTLAGYASTPHSDTYNASLSARRIACVVNQMRLWRGGVLGRYIADGRLHIVTEPHGSRTAAAARGADPVYSVEMARERRVEIIGYRCR
ncbi:MAG: outer membrane protein 3a [bacterium P3]|nr:MAG: outer membrane protein 3a [bacterium P3]KWW42611.1 MAG: outer membrane protein 3a [bacterium F083]